VPAAGLEVAGCEEAAAFLGREEASTYRICFVGESAAAGMFYTPYFTPALCLSSHLKNHGTRPYEVIDLTRNSMNQQLLLEVSEAALQLHPDCLVVLAGNNWFTGRGFRFFDWGREKIEYATELQKNQSAGLIRHFQQRVKEGAEHTVQTLSTQYTKAGVPLIFAIPPNNALWERQEPIPWLGNGRPRKWFEL
jgi:hypothetical protein